MKTTTKKYGVSLRTKKYGVSLNRADLRTIMWALRSKQEQLEQWKETSKPGDLACVIATLVDVKSALEELAPAFIDAKLDE